MLDKFYLFVFGWITTRLFGPKCDEFCPECRTCQQWAVYDHLKEMV